MFFSIFPLTSLVQRGNHGNAEKITKLVINVSCCLLMEKINSSGQTESGMLNNFYSNTVCPSQIQISLPHLNIGFSWLFF